MELFDANRELAGLEDLFMDQRGRDAVTNFREDAAKLGLVASRIRGMHDGSVTIS
ncbi:MAG: hypothetical protein JWO11_2839 [Nocardioides sp.]|nr:hypothetical protein [Nocardioides sp.]